MPHDSTSIKKTLICLAILLIVGYGIFNSRYIIQGPEISLEQLNKDTNTIISKDKTLFLKGEVQHSSYISINGRAISIDETGKFTEKLLLSSGVSIIDIYAKDKFGKEVRKKIDVLYEGETPTIDYEQVALNASASSSSPISTSTVAFLKNEQAEEDMAYGTSTAMVRTAVETEATSTPAQD